MPTSLSSERLTNLALQYIFSDIDLTNKVEVKKLLSPPHDDPA
ncbi:MAG: hypothetical protein V2A61_01250 [Calditrichota bacterium]